MIKHLRIDNRLIHGQVAVTWKSYVDAQAIIVCNDKVAADPIQQMALPLAAKDTKVLVYTIAQTLQYVENHPKESVFVVAKYPSDALAILKSGMKVETVNVGNAAPQQGTKYVMVTKSIAVTAEDAAIYHEIAELLGGELKTQMVPTYEKSDFLALLKKVHL